MTTGKVQVIWKISQRKTKEDKNKHSDSDDLY